jgi:acrosin
LDYSAYTTDVTVNLAAGTATNISNGIFGIENVTGGAGNDQITGIFAPGGSLSGSIDGGGMALLNSLTGNPGGSNWTIDGANSGTVTGIGAGFKNIANLTGGAGADRFTLETGGSLSGTLTGGGVAALDTLEGADANNNWTIRRWRG